MSRKSIYFFAAAFCLTASIATSAEQLIMISSDNPEQKAVPAPESLVALAKNSLLPSIDKLKEAYLQVQWQRIMGEAPLPPLNAGYIFGPPASALNTDEKAKFKEWMDAKPKLREHVLMALNAREDSLPGAVRIALALHQQFPKECETNENLFLAFITTWDDPFILKAMNSYGVPELYTHQDAVKTCTPEESFGWYIKNQAHMCPWFKTAPWQLMKFTAGETNLLEERDWLLKKYVFKPNLGTVYSEIVYDKSKLVDEHGKLGDKAYTLENIKTFGGVCRDQAFYARAACRAFGMPAYMATGVANSAGRHAWVGWITREGNEYKLTSHGRYVYDKYFTAEVIDPKSGAQILDYLVGIEAKALSDEKNYEDAQVYYRIWEETHKEIPASAQTALLIAAIQKNHFHRDAWMAIGEATAAGNLPLASAQKQWDFLNTNFSDFPDFTFSMVTKFERIFKTAAEKYQFYETTAKIFLKLKRQDLVAKLRGEEVAMCIAQERKDLAAQVALSAMQECAGEGADGALLAKQAVELLRETKQLSTAVKPLQFAMSHTTKVRADLLNPNWKTVAELLRDVYRELGDTKAAESVQSQIK